MNVNAQTSTVAPGLAEDILARIERDELVLPSMPDIALKLQRAIDDPNVPTDRVVSIISADPPIAAQIVKLANSPAYSSGQPVGSLARAIPRLGYRMLRNQVIALTLERMMHLGSSVLTQRLRVFWEHSREVAALSHALASGCPGLNADEAMMAGLVHDMGVLPVIMHAAQCPELQTRRALEPVLAALHGRIGRRILDSWHFAPALAAVADGHEDLARTGHEHPDYTDIVLIANLYCQQAEGHPHAAVDWAAVPAAARLGFRSPADLAQSSAISDAIARARGMLGLAPGAPASSIEAKPVLPVAIPVVAPLSGRKTNEGFLAWLRRLFGFATG